MKEIKLNGNEIFLKSKLKPKDECNFQIDEIKN